MDPFGTGPQASGSVGRADRSAQQAGGSSGQKAPRHVTAATEMAQYMPMAAFGPQVAIAKNMEECPSPWSTDDPFDGQNHTKMDDHKWGYQHYKPLAMSKTSKTI